MGSFQIRGLSTYSNVYLYSILAKNTKKHIVTKPFFCKFGYTDLGGGRLQFLHWMMPIYTNKDKNVHRFAISAIKGKERKREIKRDSFGILYTGYLLS